ncbi:hypothetical protein N7451_009857 [Penicillium sp. IBT 35674x]|nr:hypothetical protein N7451_009857 [Penicillium sp. IBT 35674x]
MTVPFRRPDLTNALLDLNLSDTKSSSAHSKRPTASRRQFQFTIRSPGKKTNAKISLLTLPVEIRLQIYEFLLVSQADPEQSPSWAVGNTSRKMISLHMIQAPHYRTLEPAILYTCTQIHREAASVLYGGNVFNFSEPGQMFRFMAQIGPTNTKFMRSLDTWVPWKAEISPWLTLLNTLSKDATGIRYIELAWGANCESPLIHERGAKERGLGDNVLFIRALAKIQGLERIHLKGYFAMHWPSYLMASTGARVQAERGQHHEPGPDDDAATIQLVQHVNERSLRRFRDYQRGTDDLVP